MAEKIYNRAGAFAVDFVMEHIGQVVTTASGIKIQIGGWRVEAYSRKGTKCSNCGLVGNMFAAECFRKIGKGEYPNNRRHHFNLYHVAADGTETMMTVDHIIPKSKGGNDEINNLQPMCFQCNQKKGNQV